MTTIFYDDLNKVCRGCLCKNGEMRPLFGSFLDNMLRAVAEIEVQAGDGLPQLMCVPCVLQVSRAFTFKQLCQRSDQTLRTFYREIEKCMANNRKPENLKQTKAIIVNKTNENVVSSVAIFPKSDEDVMSQSIACERTSVLTPFLPKLTDKLCVTNHLYNNIQYQNAQNVQDSNNIDKCLLMVNNDDESSQLPNSALDTQVNVADSDIVNLITSVTSDGADQLTHADTFTCVGVVKSPENDSIMDNFMEENVLPTEESMEQDIKVDVLAALPVDSGVIEEDLIDENFDSYSDNGSNGTLEDNNKNDLILNIFSTSSLTNPDVNSPKQSAYDNVQPHPESIIRVVQMHPSTNSVAEEKKPKSFECPTCHKVFAENKILKRHLKIHNPIKPHVCNVCEMSFAESSNLTKHHKKHTGELRNIVGKPNLCSVCGKGFKWASSLSKHMKHHTRHKILNCPYCTKYYVEARSLNIHLRSHTGEKPFTCDVCQKAFTQMGNLEKHMRVHTGEKPYTCPICNKRFSQSGYVAIHLRTHTGEKPYTCTECGKSFAGSSTLSIHKRTHTGERPYQCGICEKAFARHETAVIHERTHTGTKPHICLICNRGFTSSGHLNGHMRSHNGIKTHECTVCNKRFAGSSSLKVHMKTHEPKTPSEQYVVQAQFTNLTSDLKTFYECGVCNQNIPTSALATPETLKAYDHLLMDGVLICSNVKSIVEQVNEGTVIEEIQVENGTNIIVARSSPMAINQENNENETVVVSSAALKLS